MPWAPASPPARALSSLFQSLFSAGPRRRRHCDLARPFVRDLGIGIPSGITLIVMVLLAVIDFRRTHEPRSLRTHLPSIASSSRGSDRSPIAC